MTKRKDKTNILMERFYKVLNKVQTKNKKQIFEIKKNNLEKEKIFENIIKDSNLFYEKKKSKSKIKFIIYPNENKEKKYFAELLEIEHYDDEIPEDGFIF